MKACLKNQQEIDGINMGFDILYFNNGIDWEVVYISADGAALAWVVQVKCVVVEQGMGTSSEEVTQVTKTTLLDRYFW